MDDAFLRPATSRAEFKSKEYETTKRLREKWYVFHPTALEFSSGNFTGPFVLELWLILSGILESRERKLTDLYEVTLHPHVLQISNDTLKQDATGRDVFFAKNDLARYVGS